MINSEIGLYFGIGIFVGMVAMYFIMMREKKDVSKSKSS